ncbi:hypothetical protein HNQ94_003890 [Salirhabdus euzebyi]|uniref:Cof-type HAD-IIB family hydrolase n=1 Tax=Salirhabdus euzebyi TaxID=394506 RepID=A0A841QAE8_9BACI|nr:Cof-type HAD-IIB family hydrolase [Salirhabdus euzebyi]MBB6455390.1 hypothetical protein [Salirhabdus euzebyi]
MTPKQIVFFDIDGTLIHEGNDVVEETVEAIEQLKQNGIYPAIATGRAPFMFKHIRDRLNINSFVSFNGQYVVFEGEVVYENPLQRDYITRLLSFAGEQGHPVAYLGKDKMTVTEENHTYIADSLGSLKLPYPEVDASFYQVEKVYQALVFCEDKEAAPYIKEHDFFDFIRWHDYSMDVLPQKGSKAYGIKKLIEHVGFDRENTFAFGDGLNDTEMLQFVGTGVAMGNAKEEVKAHADIVTKDVTDNGVVYGLKKLGLL